MNKINEKEYNLIWDKFYREFDFKPSVYPQDWPGITEPTPSFTISLTESDYGVCPDSDIILNFFKNAFNKLTGSNKISYILDWQHTCYHAPKVFNDNLWVYPDGDYAICLNHDMTVGTFGHPWEQTICIFGSALIEITRNFLPKEYSRVLRENA